jgi:REP element-mobilizing transposase RayT
MPNHVHGIIILTDVGANSYSPLPVPTPFRSPSKNLGAIIRGFKSSVTVRMNQLHNTPRQPVWQRGYYEHIIRNTKELDNVRKYILANPAQWQTDDEYPENNTVAE